MHRTCDDVLHLQQQRLLARLHVVRQQQCDAAWHADHRTMPSIDAVIDPLERETLRLMETELVARLADLELQIERRSKVHVSA